MSGPVEPSAGRAVKANQVPSGEYAADCPTTTTFFAICTRPCASGEGVIRTDGVGSPDGVAVAASVGSTDGVGLVAGDPLDGGCDAGVVLGESDGLTAGDRDGDPD